MFSFNTKFNRSPQYYVLSRSQTNGTNSHGDNNNDDNDTSTTNNNDTNIVDKL